MVCSRCKNEIENLNFYSLRKNDKILDFCCKDCITDYMNEHKNDLKGFELNKVSRCVGYYDCLRLDNIRGICEDVDPVQKKSHAFDLARSLKPPQCNPGNVAIIKSSIKMMDLFEKFDAASTQISSEMLDHTKAMSKLTKWMLGFTILNLFFVAISIWLTFTPK